MSDKTARIVMTLEMWLAFADDHLSEFDIEGDDCDPESRLCPRCRDCGCIQYKIRETRALCDELSATKDRPS